MLLSYTEGTIQILYFKRNGRASDTTMSKVSKHCLKLKKKLRQLERKLLI